MSEGSELWKYVGLARPLGRWQNDSLQPRCGERGAGALSLRSPRPRKRGSAPRQQRDIIVTFCQLWLSPTQSRERARLFLSRRRNMSLKQDQPLRMPSFLRSLALGFLISISLPVTSTRAADPQELPAQNVEERPFGEELIGPYGQPRWSARGRFSSDTDVYVLPPYSFFVDLDYDGTILRRGKPDHLFGQEYELGLPYRFQIAWEFYEEAINGHREVPFTLIEARYAFADWGKIPFNPTFLGEYKFGTGRNYFGKETDHSDTSEEDAAVTKRIPNSYELRLLLGQEIFKSIEFAANFFMEQGLSADRERELGFSTAWSYALRGEALKIGLETKYSNESQPGQRHSARNIFQLGPSFTYKPTAHTRLDIAPLAGMGRDSPRLETFLIFSIDFGTGETQETEGPVSGEIHH